MHARFLLLFMWQALRRPLISACPQQPFLAVLTATAPKSPSRSTRRTIMSMETVATLKRISADNLARMLREQGADVSSEGSKIAIVDVRDDDYLGGHIKGSINCPSRALDTPTLLRRLADKETVVFHCMLSQQRGPSAALRYLREKDAAAARAGGLGAQNIHQKLLVLDRGFQGWQEKFAEDKSLTEGYRKDLWDDMML
ncbi:Rhodanese-like domain-containing protein [Microdochium trichocladiopsis]|uniref:Rhodanese-like domain-containing protein n=1 Tax=Microdochium trichocladiopsis TaxID=1682393 RepID=A0A9P8Y7P9_9PEZI|nr:Rhodanese-like domain-containing protein [Microdochium trichocladiopsis]KAH7031675.1 Rhodanese-like domain-containing protein [Microdochium trichocladiopsis]